MGRVNDTEQTRLVEARGGGACQPNQVVWSTTMRSPRTSVRSQSATSDLSVRGPYDLPCLADGAGPHVRVLAVHGGLGRVQPFGCPGMPLDFHGHPHGR